MLSLITTNPIPFILALIIGLVTAWWIWGRLPSIDAGIDETAAPEADPAPAPAPEPVLAAAPIAAAAASAPTTKSAKPNIAAAVGDPDDLKRVKGIGPKLEKLCNSLGVMRFDQIAAWGASEIAEVDAHLGSFKGRIERDEWVAQAKLLAAGDDAGHVAKYGA